MNGLTKLLLDYRNPVNRVMAQENNRDYVPVVGSYMTMLGSSNRTVWEVVHIDDEASDILLRECTTRPVDKDLAHGHQTWDTKPDAGGTVVRVVRRKDGTWRQWRKVPLIFVPGNRYYYAWT